MRSKPLFSVAVLLALGWSHNAGADGNDHEELVVTVSDMLMFPAGPGVQGATILTREDDGVRVDVSTLGLDPYAAYSVWLAIFNNPRRCLNGPHQCTGGNDLPNSPSYDPRINASLLWVGGGVTDSDGALSLSAELLRGMPPGEVVMGNPRGLRNIWDADIHVALRTHGAAVPGMVAEQIGSFNGGCTPPDFPECANRQISVHVGE